MSTANKATLRRFKLVRVKDVSGVSGTGIVAEGVEWSNGWVDIHWLSQKASKEFFENMRVLVDLHGHEGATMVEWIDD